MRPVLVVVVILVTGTHSQDTCLVSGRFRSLDPTCRNYYLCVKSKGLFVSRKYICPEPSIFNPSSGRCSVDAHCIDNICRYLPPSITKIVDPNGHDCKTYIECVGPEGQRYPTVRTCEVGYFNKDLLPEPGCCLTKNC
ncbi:hypothetical protein Zmor_009554 [Zophobas morio]|uniref:Chitin-binding type-2 domain-containing protein n=1 Tax=Zophobas morio TaxID=2755281 RepID=A0AA38MIS1_9CUCU|nr:hypothetical protein Zmor_009554 [Zophobas morio]